MDTSNITFNNSIITITKAMTKSQIDMFLKKSNETLLEQATTVIKNTITKAANLNMNKEEYISFINDFYDILTYHDMKSTSVNESKRGIITFLEGKLKGSAATYRTILEASNLINNLVLQKSFQEKNSDKMIYVTETISNILLLVTMYINIPVAFENKLIEKASFTNGLQVTYLDKKVFNKKEENTILELSKILESDENINYFDLSSKQMKTVLYGEKLAKIYLSYRIMSLISLGKSNIVRDALNRDGLNYDFSRISDSIESIINHNNDNKLTTANEDDLKEILNTRRYVYAEEGVNIKINSSNDNKLDIVSVKEDNKVILISLKIKDEDDSSLDILNLASSKKEIPMYIEAIIDKAYAEKENIFDAIYIPRIKELTRSKEVIQELKVFILKIVFAAICMPKSTSKSAVKFSYPNKENKSTKKKTYSVAYIRKLPIGASMSNTAKDKAKNAGFTFIPRGFTFVSAANTNLSTKKTIVL